MFHLILQSALTLSVLLFIWILYKKAFLPHMAYRRLAAQGVVFKEHPLSPVIGDLLLMEQFAEKEPHRSPLIEIFKEENGQWPPMSGLVMPNCITVMFNRAEQLEDLYVTHNALLTRSEIMQQLFVPLMDKSMGNMDTFNPHFKKKR